MRKQPSVPPPSVTHRVHNKMIEQVRTYKIITPLFGGGAIDHRCDEITTVRGSEIRGHLRFWWRATCAGHFADIQAVKEREDAIWGKANTKQQEGPKHEETMNTEKQPSGPRYEETVQIEVSEVKETDTVAPFRVEPYRDRSGRERNREVSVSSTHIHDYAAFPLRLPKEELDALPVPPPERASKEISREGITFTLTITFPDKYKHDVETALWAWETFGGLGARTRRGFGALQLLKLQGKSSIDSPLPPTSSNQAKQWLEEKLKDLPTKDHGIRDIPALHPETNFCIIEGSNPISVWKTLIEKLCAFRQGQDGRFHRTSGKNKFGRSYWPEAEAVRELTGWRRSDLPERGHPEKFPRAAFGLPIIFHFIREDQRNKDNPDVRKTKDPADATLQASPQNDRLASPLILKPLACQNGEGCGLAIILDGTAVPSSLVLKEQGGRKHLVEHQLMTADLQALPSLKLDNNTNILEAFLNYLKRR